MPGWREAARLLGLGDWEEKKLGVVKYSWVPVGRVSVRNLELGAAAGATREAGLEKSVEGSSTQEAELVEQKLSPLQVP